MSALKRVDTDRLRVPKFLEADLNLKDDLPDSESDSRVRGHCFMGSDPWNLLS